MNPFQSLVTEAICKQKQSVCLYMTLLVPLVILKVLLNVTDDCHDLGVRAEASFSDQYV